MIAGSIASIGVVIAAMWVVPNICRRIHVPPIVGFILAGMLIGPHGLALLEGSDTISVLGKIGILYIMLQSGIEVDVNDFRQYRQAGICFGIYSFLLPFVLGILSSRFILQLDWTCSILMGAMYGSHTLMTYPIVSRYGIQKNAAVNIVVGGTMPAIFLSLLTLAIVVGMQRTDTGLLFWAKSIAMMAGFFFVVLWGYPRLAQWFFKRNQDPIACYTLVMALLVVAAWLADVSGLESILGAFLCGVALNRSIPNKSPLMGNINFVGNTIFVPMFLIGVGFLIDIRVCWAGWTVVLIALTMISTKLIGKWLAAWAIQKQEHMTKLERMLCFGLSHAAAAGTLAIISIGYEMGLLSEAILSAAVLMILILCSLSSFITEYAAKGIALQEEERLESLKDNNHWMLLSVGEDVSQPMHEMVTLSELTNVDYHQTYDWQDARQLVANRSTCTLLYHPTQPISTIQRILVAVPRYAEKEPDFISCFGQIRRLSSAVGAKVIFFANTETQTALRKFCSRPGKFLRAGYREMTDWEDVLMIAKEIREDDLLIMVSARHATPSYNRLFEQIPEMLTRFFADHSYILLYPEQEMGGPTRDTLLTDLPQASATWSIVSAIKQGILRAIRKFQTF